MFVLRTLIDTCNRRGKKLYTCFVDFQKAFDSVWRGGMIYKLLKYGLNMDYVKAIDSMYSKTSICLKMNNCLTPQFRTYCGVKQGCILSPKLFNLFINDIPSIFDSTCFPVSLGKKSLSCLMYADDLLMFSENAEGLQKCLDKLSIYTRKWGLKVNLKKTKVLIFQSRGKRPQYSFFLGHQQVSIEKSYKYLGTTISDTGSFKTNETLVKKKGLRASYLIIKSIGKHAKPSTAISIFEKVVEPILTYNCEVTQAYIPIKWDFSKFQQSILKLNKQLNMVVISFLRQILGVHKKTMNAAIMAETGKLPISLKIFTSIFKYWIRTFTCESDLVRQAILCNSTWDKRGQCWIKIIHFLLLLTNLQDVRPTDDENNNRKIFITFKKRLILVLKDIIQSEIKNSPKLDYYKKYKKVVQFENYLDNVPPCLRIHVSRLRLSSHNLPIETLRYGKKKVERKNRICKLCS